MSRHKTRRFSNPNPFVPPHVVGKLLNAETGEWQMPSLKQGILSEHFSKCLFCQVTVAMIVEETLQHDRTHGLPADSSQKLLTQLKVLIHETLRASMGPYIDVCKLEGEKEANKRFHDFAKHLKECQECRQLVNETLTLLAEIEDVENTVAGGKRH